jgi:CheY-like chemotaxis protein
VPIVALTASALPGDERRCLDAGLDAHLRKPLQPEQLALVLRTLALGEPPAFEEAEAVARFGGSRELFERVVRRFLESQAGMEARLVEALERGDLVELGRASHSLRGAIGLVSARAAMRATVDLEGAASRGDHASCRALLADLRRELGRLGEALAGAIVTAP